MNTLKLFLLGTLVLAICSSQVQAQCNCGVGSDIDAYFYGSDLPVVEAHVGDVLYYYVSVYTAIVTCPLENGQPIVEFADGATLNLPLFSFPTASGFADYYTKDYTGGLYTVKAGDVKGGVVSAWIHVTADCIPSDVDPASSDSPSSVPIVSNPNTTVGIEASPEQVAPGEEVTLTITEQNTGVEDLTDVRVEVYEDTGSGEVLLVTLGYDAGWPPDNGDGGVVGTLDKGVPSPPGETWTWTVPVNPLVPTIYIAYGFGTDPLGNIVSFDTDYVNERAEAPVGVVPPPCVEVTKEVDCDVSKAGDTVTYHYCIHNCGPLPVVVLDWFDTVVPYEVIGEALLAQCGGVLEPDDELPGGPDECCFDVDFVIPEDDPFGDPLVNGFAVLVEDIIHGQITDSGELVLAQVDIVHPDFTATKNCREEPLVVGELAVFDIRIENTGDVCLHFDLTEDGIPIIFDLAAGDVREWETIIPVETEDDVTNTIIGTATLLVGDPIGICGEPSDCLDNVLPVEFEDTCTVEVPEEGCRLTGGGVDEEDSIVPIATSLSTNNNRIQFGGQAGANTALPPQPKGEWTHHQQRGPSGSFTFHGGTASAPAGTEVIEIRCSDPGGCKPSGDPPSPAKQVDFDGIGTFKNFGKAGTDREPNWLISGVNAKCSSKGGKWRFDGTFHYFQVNADDNGEPGNQMKGMSAEICPPNGFGEKGDLPLAECDCPDFYRITIYNGVDADTPDLFLPDGNIDLSKLNTTDVIYEFHGYLDGGNLQIHHLTGYDRNLTYNDSINLNLLAANWLKGF